MPLRPHNGFTLTWGQVSRSLDVAQILNPMAIDREPTTCPTPQQVCLLGKLVLGTCRYLMDLSMPPALWSTAGQSTRTNMS